MEKFTKEQLIKHAQRHIAHEEWLASKFGDAHSKSATVALAEIALAALTAPQATDAGEHFQRGYDEGHSRGLACGKLYKVDDQMRQHRAECVKAYRAEINGGEID